MQVKLIYNKMEKVLNEKESLDLIVKTIEQTRRRVEKNAGLPMLIFGYLSVLTSLVVGFFFHVPAITGTTFFGQPSRCWGGYCLP